MGLRIYFALALLRIKGLKRFLKYGIMKINI